MTITDARSPDAQSEVARTGRTPAPLTGYRAHLDGLRTVAVYMVVVFHCGVGRAEGGFIGVDIFFVLSGYLVTQVLLRDLHHSGGIRFGRFYSRRFRRLLPAAFVALVGTALAFTAVATPAEVADTLGSFKAAFLYVANWHFIAESSDYFADDVSGNPVLHFWSLAVEEQFYLVWPLLLAGVVAVSRRLGHLHWHVVRIIVGSLALASLVGAMALRVDDANRAYYGSDTRAYQLLAGALLAMMPGLVGRSARLGRWAAAVVSATSLGGVLVIATPMVGFDPVERGLATTVLTLVLIISLEVPTGGATKTILSTGPVVYLGKISYGTYLWHWPVIVILSRLVNLSHFQMVIATVLLGTALAALSAELVELPIRRSPRLGARAPAAIAVGLTISVVSALVLMPTVMEPARAGTVGAAEPGFGGTTAPDEGAAVPPRGLTPIPTTFDQLEIHDQRFGESHHCLGEPASACTVREGAGAHILLIGDSNAVMLRGMFESMAERHDLTLSLSVKAACSWKRGYEYDAKQDQELCLRLQDDVHERLVDELDPDIVIAVDVRGGRTVTALEFGAADPEVDRAVRDATDRSVADMEAADQPMLVIEPLPRAVNTENPLDCLARAEFVEDCRFINRGPNWLEEHLRELESENDLLHVADLDRLACPLDPICDPVVDGTVMWWDEAHLSRDGALSIEDGVWSYLVVNDLIAPANQ